MGRAILAPADRGHVPSRPRATSLSGQVLHKRYQLVTPVATLSAERQCFLQFHYNGSPVGGPGNPDRPPTPYLQEPFVSEKMEGPQNSVRIDAKHHRQVLGLGDFVPWQCLAVCDGSSNLRCDLFVQEHGLPSVDSREGEPGIICRLGVTVDRAYNNNDSSFMETMEAPTLISASSVPPDAEALFKEAQRRRRNRRLLGSGIVVAVLAVMSLVGFAVSGSGNAVLPVIPLAQPAFASTVIKATTTARGASFTLVDRVPLPECTSSTGPQAVVYGGSIDFVHRAMTYSAVDSACPTLPDPLTILTPTASYRFVGTNVAPGIGTTALRPWLKSPSSVQDRYFSVASTMLDPDVGVLLRAVQGPLAMGPTTVVGGVSSTEYRATTTLAMLEHSDNAMVVGQPGTVVPDAASVVIPVGIWVDDHGRITRVTASEPVFSEVYADGSTESGPQVGATGSQIPPAPATSSPREVGLAKLTLTFTGFGPRAISLPSAAATIASAR